MPTGRGRDDDPATDAVLLLRARDWRDGGAWSELVARYDRLVRRRCRRVGAAGGDVDELAQRTWLKVARRMTTFAYDPSRSFRGWLGRVAASETLDHLRRLGRRPTPATLDGREPPAIVEPTTVSRPAAPSSRPSRARQARALEAVRDRVDPESWEAFRRVVEGGESVADVARSMGKTYAAVYMAIQRIRRMLREEAEGGTP